MIFVCDGSQPLDEQDNAIIELCENQEKAIALINKTDLGRAVEPGDLPFLMVVPFCAKTGEGLSNWLRRWTGCLKTSCPATVPF